MNYEKKDLMAIDDFKDDLPEIISWLLAHGSQKIISEPVPLFQTSQKGQQKLAASPPTLRAGFLGFGVRSLIVSL